MAQKLNSDAINHFVDDLKSTHGDNLLSVVLYGGSGQQKDEEVVNTYGLLVVLKRLAAADLRQARGPVREWQRIGFPAPSYFSGDELKQAADVFPIEFLRMERSRKILFGADPFEFVELSDENLRHQVEYELRAKLLQLRRLYIDSFNSGDDLQKLLIESLGTFAGLFQSVLFLMDVDVPQSRADRVREIVRRLNIDPNPFEAIFALRSASDSSIDNDVLNDLFANYMVQIELVIDYVDRIES